MAYTNLNIGGEKTWRARTTGWIAPVACILAAALPARGAVQFRRPPLGNGAVHVSAWVDPNGSDADMYAYESFIPTSNAAITEVRWRGGYTVGGFGGPVTDFTVTFFASIGGGSQPLVGNPQLEDTSPIYLAKFWVGSNAGETLAGIFGGMTMYDYSYVLPAPFPVVAGTKYWLRIEASQVSYPSWGIAGGTYEDGHYFNFSTGAAMFLFYPGDFAFTLMSASVPQGDMNCDGVVDVGDVPAFVSALLDAAAYAAANPTCDFANGDMNGDGKVDGADIQTFVRAVIP